MKHILLIVLLGASLSVTAQTKLSLSYDDALQMLQKGNQIVGVEVKKGEHVRSRSLGVFVNSYKPAYSIRFSLKNFGEKDGLKSVPLYAAFCV